jgi:hypothetical protein
LHETNPDAHAQLVEWNKFQLGFKNNIKYSLPYKGNHPAETLKVIFEWDSSKTNAAKDVENPVGACSI